MMKKILLGLFLLTGTVTAAGTLTNANIASNAAIAFSKLASLTSGNILVGSSGNVATSVALSGDCTMANTGAITCTKTNGSNFAASATTNALNASNISSGTLGLARGGTNADLSATGGTAQVLFQTSAGGAVTVARPTCSTLSNAATSCSTDATDMGNASAGTLAVGRGGTGQSTYTNGQLLIGNTTGNTLTKATLTEGAGITITNGGGSITIATSTTGLGDTVRFIGANATSNGSTNTKIRNFAKFSQSGTSMTGTLASTAVGSYVRVEIAGTYDITYRDENTGSTCEFGLSKNSTALTTNIRSIHEDQRLWAGTTSANDRHQTIHWLGALAVGDSIRAHGDGNCTATANGDVEFLMTRVR